MKHWQARIGPAPAQEPSTVPHLDRRNALNLTAAALVAPSSSLADGPIRLRDLYDRNGGFSPLARDHKGQRVEIAGYMAPPLKANAWFFVLTKMPMAVCPFCETEAEWPEDILAVYTKRQVKPVPFNVKIKTRGILALGALRDPETGFLSLIRLVDATYG